MNARTEKVHAAESLRREGWPTTKIARVLGQSGADRRKWFRQPRDGKRSAITQLFAAQTCPYPRRVTCKASPAPSAASNLPPASPPPTRVTACRSTRHKLRNVVATYLQIQDGKRTAWQRFVSPKALPLSSTLLVVIPLVLQISSVLGIAIQGLGKTADADLRTRRWGSMGLSGVSDLKSPYPWFGGKSRIMADGGRDSATCELRRSVPRFARSCCSAVPNRSREPKPSTILMGSSPTLASGSKPTRGRRPIRRLAGQRACLHARHAWLVGRKDSIQSRLEGDPSGSTPRSPGGGAGVFVAGSVRGGARAFGKWSGVGQGRCGRRRQPENGPPRRPGVASTGRIAGSPEYPSPFSPIVFAASACAAAIGRGFAGRRRRQCLVWRQVPSSSIRLPRRSGRDNRSTARINDRRPCRPGWAIRHGDDPEDADCLMRLRRRARHAGFVGDACRGRREAVCVSVDQARQSQRRA